MIRTIVVLALAVAAFIGATAAQTPPKKNPCDELPWPEWKVRWAASLFSEETLRRMAADNNIKITPQIEAKIKACLRS